MKLALLNVLVTSMLMASSSGAVATTLTYQFYGVFTHDVAKGAAHSVINGREIRLPSVAAGDRFRGTLSYSTNQLLQATDTKVRLRCNTSRLNSLTTCFRSALAHSGYISRTT